MAKMTDLQKCRCFLWLINILRSNRYTRAQLSEMMMEQEFYQDQPEMERKTFRRFLDTVEELYGVVIEKYSDRRYYIERTNYRSDFQGYVDDALALMQLRGADRFFEKYVAVEAIPVSDPWLTLLGHALSLRRKVLLTYRKFDSNKTEEYLLTPLALRQSKKRWYLLAYKADGNRRTFCFDRIKDVKILNEKIPANLQFDAKKHYKYAIGVYVDNCPLEDVVINASSYVANYIRTNPLSPEQREVRELDGTSTFTVKILVNYELENELMSMLPYIDIISPLSLREKIKNRMHFKSDKNIPDTQTQP